MFVGVTGQIGSGKSTAATILGELGGVVISADEVGRDVVENNKTLLTRLARSFGADILDKPGVLNRQKLANRAFADNESRDKLNQLVHPYLLRELARRMKALSEKHDVVIVDAALIPNWGLCTSLDFVLVVHASAEVRLRRLIQRGVDPDDARARQKAQLKFSAYRECADRIVLNNSSVDRLRRKIERIWRREILKRIDR